MRNARGITLIETAVALVLLTIAIATSASYSQSFRLQDAVLWDEFCADELALSVLEDLRTKPPAITAATGIAYQTSGPQNEKLSTTLSDTKVNVRVLPAEGEPALLEVRVEVSWVPTIQRGERRATIERKALLRGRP